MKDKNVDISKKNERLQSVSTEVVLLDIEGFSLMSAENQAKAAVLVNVQLDQLLKIMSGQSLLSVDEVVAGFVPTGDGFYVIVQPTIVGYGIVLAISLRAALMKASKRAGSLLAGVRIGTHFGQLTEFYDVTGRENYVGPVMNECARLLGAKLDQAPEGFMADSNYVICSQSAQARFRAAYNYDDANSYFRDPKIGIKFSNWIEVVDKHKKVHLGAFVESSRNVAFTPPKPPDFDDRMRKRIAEIQSRYSG